METSNLLVIAAIVVIVLAVGNIFMIMSNNPQVLNKITGNALASGYVNITMVISISINFSRDTMNWGSGTIDAGVTTNATLFTIGDGAASVVRGNWSTAPQALILDNIGNVNASLTLQTGKTAQQFFGGTNPFYAWNVSNRDQGACWGGVTLNVWAPVNQSAPEKFCSQFSYLNGQNTLSVDILMAIPYDFNLTGAQSDVITAVASTAS